ncbi:MAG TPA: PEP-CTERM sorting domain-containing protein [Terriglobales bacterium]|nr:PEP-CTERM sorting domain-containing protein [Terriglobales bacterium]
MSTSKALLFVAVLVCLPLAAFANSTVDFGYTGGRLSTPTNSYITTGPIGTTLTTVNGYNGGGLVTGSNLGTINFTTGARVSGGMGGNATFAPGGSIVITANGSGGLPTGVLFTGTFTGTTTWTVSTVTIDGQQLYSYTLSGTISGQFSNGQTVSGQTFTISVLTRQTFHGSIGIQTGGMSMMVTPEPGTLSLFGTGLIGLAGLARRKFRGL